MFVCFLEFLLTCRGVVDEDALLLRRDRTPQDERSIRLFVFFRLGAVLLCWKTHRALCPAAAASAAVWCVCASSNLRSFVRCVVRDTQRRNVRRGSAAVCCRILCWISGRRLSRSRAVVICQNLFVVCTLCARNTYVRAYICITFYHVSVVVSFGAHV